MIITVKKGGKQYSAAVESVPRIGDDVVSPTVSGKVKKVEFNLENGSITLTLQL